MAEGTTPAKINGFDKKVVRGFADRIDNIEKDLLSEKGTYMAACKSLREDIAAIFTEAKDQNIPKKELKAALKKRKLLRQANAIGDDFGEDGQGTFDALWIALEEAA